MKYASPASAAEALLETPEGLRVLGDAACAAQAAWHEFLDIAAQRLGGIEALRSQYNTVTTWAASVAKAEVESYLATEGYCPRPARGSASVAVEGLHELTRQVPTPTHELLAETLVAWDHVDWGGGEPLNMATARAVVARVAEVGVDRAYENGWRCLMPFALKWQGPQPTGDALRVRTQLELLHKEMS